ncbi:DUF1145 domain-containing protein [Arsenophonus endosymbiont of Bemisia tabaci]|uniref:DUF1145 domain-containing protein n=1 Tax=Arsenophonus endosymbiont of Bemisia tabaci TaxID=536059 RepID=UPI0030B807A5
MLFNLIHPFPKPLKYFINVAMIFMIFMHAMQGIFLHAAFAKTEKHPCWLQIKIFLSWRFSTFSLAEKTKN